VVICLEQGADLHMAQLANRPTQAVCLCGRRKPHPHGTQDYGEDSGVLLNSVIYTVSVP